MQVSVQKMSEVDMKASMQKWLAYTYSLSPEHLSSFSSTFQELPFIPALTPTDIPSSSS